MRDKKLGSITKTPLANDGYFIGIFINGQQLGYWEVVWRKGFKEDVSYYAR